MAWMMEMEGLSDNEKTALGQKAAKLGGKIRKLRKELKGYREEAERKTLKTNELKKQLVRQTIAA